MASSNYFIKKDRLLPGAINCVLLRGFLQLTYLTYLYHILLVCSPPRSYPLVYTDPFELSWSAPYSISLPESLCHIIISKWARRIKIRMRSLRLAQCQVGDSTLAYIRLHLLASSLIAGLTTTLKLLTRTSWNCFCLFRTLPQNPIASRGWAPHHHLDRFREPLLRDGWWLF